MQNAEALPTLLNYILNQVIKRWVQIVSEKDFIKNRVYFIIPEVIECAEFGIYSCVCLPVFLKPCLPFFGIKAKPIVQLTPYNRNVILHEFILSFTRQFWHAANVRLKQFWFNIKNYM